MKYKIFAEALPNIPWENKPQDCDEIIWRSEKNPIITRDAIKDANSIFNSAVVPFEGKFAGVFRADDRGRNLRIHAGFSDDGVNWTMTQKPIYSIMPDNTKRLVIGYDPRVCFLEDRYYITFCTAYDGPTVAMLYTYDFVDFYDMGNMFLPFNRNGVLIPKKINGKYAMYSRPSDAGHTPFGDIFYSESPDLKYWGEHRHVMSQRDAWSGTKIGAGPVPVETSEGWLLIYHGVLNSCNGFVYSMGVAVMDREKPWQVKYRANRYLLAPHMLYEQVGDVPNVVFPCATLCDADTGRISIYYGGADTVVCMAYSYVDDLVDFAKKYSDD